jgi:signal transduction histidine kinase
VLVNDVENDPRHVPTPGATGIRAELAVPIRLAERVLGVLNVESPDAFDEDDAASLEIVSDQLAVGIENARLYERGQMLAVLQERQRLARDLHDSVTQQIFAMNLIAESLATVWQRDEAEGRRRSERLFDLSRAALAEMRSLVAGLRPDDGDLADLNAVTGIALLRKQGLVAAIRRLLDEYAADDLVLDLDVHRYRSQDREMEQSLFRITQEAISNAVKHAGAKTINVILRADHSTVRLSIRDDGCGFDVHAASHSVDTSGTGYGLTTMRERAQGLDGILELRSSPGRGTVIEAVVPTRMEIEQ